MIERDLVLEELQKLHVEVDALKASQTRIVDAAVTSADSGTSTFAVEVLDQDDGSQVPLDGIFSSPQSLPAPGTSVRLAVRGAQPVYLADQIAEGAVGERELDGAVVQTIEQAAADAYAAIQTADGKNTMHTSPLTPFDAGINGTASGDIWWQRNPTNGVIVGTWEWDGNSWEPRTFGNAVFDTISAGKISTGTLGAGVAVTAGDPTTDHTVLSGAGLGAYAPDPAGNPVELARWGRTLGGRNLSTGRQTYSVDEDGVASFTGLYTTGDPVIQGRRLVGDLLWNLPWGRQATSVDIPLVGPHVSEQGIYEMGFTAQPGRQYEIRSTPIALRNETVPTRGTLAIRYTTSGLSPTLSSPIMTLSTSEVISSEFPWENPSNFVSGTYRNDTGGPLQVRILLTVNTFGGGGVHFYKEANVPWLLYINDMGPAITGVGQTNNLRADGSSTAPPPATSPPQDRVANFLATWTRSWNENGSVQADGIAYQGYYPGNGNTRSMIGFDAMSPTLAGSSITRIEAYLYFNHWYNNSGGTAIIGAHGAAGVPGAWGRLGDPLVFSSGWPKPGGRWVDLPLSWADGFANGNIKGITLGPGEDTNAVYYGRADGSSSAANKPTLRISYRK